MGLAVVSGSMIVLSVVQRLNFNGAAATGDSSPEVCGGGVGYSTLPPMMSSRCGMGTVEFQGKLLVCGGSSVASASIPAHSQYVMLDNLSNISAVEFCGDDACCILT